MRKSDDTAVVRIYARENATQRGNEGTAQIGSVASAVRLGARQIATGSLASTIVEAKRDRNYVLEAFESESGIGEPVISRILDVSPRVR